MEVSIKLKEDSYNTHPTGSLVITGYGDWVQLELSDDDRKVLVSRKELKAAMAAMEALAD